MESLSTFRALRHRNFRLWFYGQLTSLVGTWMQSIAQNWLVYEMTGSARDLGLVNFAAALPIIPLTLWAGQIADRFDKRKIILWMQAVMSVLAFVLAGLCFAGVVQVWHVVVLSFLLGTAQAIDTPARQAFVVELVGKEDLGNAIALNSGIFHGARVVGPAVAGILVATTGVTGAFLINGVSFAAVIVGLAAMDVALIRRTGATAEQAKEIGGGFRYLRDNVVPGTIVLLVSAFALFAMPYHVLIPVLVKERFGHGAGEYGFLMAAAGLGAVLGSLFAASAPASRIKGKLLVGGSFAIPFALVLLAYARDEWSAAFVLFLGGIAFVLQSAAANTLLQHSVPDHLRGRVLAVYVSLFLGLMRGGSLLVGELAQDLSVNAALWIISIVSLAATVAAVVKVPSLTSLE